MYTQPLGVINRYRINQAIPSVLASDDDTTGDTPTLTSLPTTTPDSDPDMATLIHDAVLPGDISTASLIHITALPPATTSPHAVLPKLPYHRQLNTLYLIPLFITLGVALGAITVAILLEWRDKRRRLRRTSTLLPGPPYVPPENDVEDRLLVHGYPSMEQVSLFAASTPSKFTIHGSRYVPKRKLAWPTLDATQPAHTKPTYTQTIIPSNDGERFTVVTQEDPFLATSPMVTRQSPKLSNDAALPKISISPSLPDPIPGNDSSHHQALDTNLPKPFRRSMFDILKLKGPYRPVPSLREEYTVLPSDDEPVDITTTNGVRRANGLKISKASADHSGNARGSLGGGLNIADMEDALGLLDFRDDKQDLTNVPLNSPKQTLRLKEGTLSSPTQSGNAKKPRKVTPFTSESEGLSKEAMNSEDQSIKTCNGDSVENHSDIYTKAPQRRRSRTSHKRLSGSGTPRRSSAPDTHASVLPLSPPSLMSPPLEKSLFFTTSLSSSASLASRMNVLAGNNFSPLRNVDESPETYLFPLPSNKTKKATKKLRTSRPVPPLPYPPYPNHVPAQPTPRGRSISAATKRPLVSPGSPRPKGHSTSATHQESTTGIYSLGSLSPTSLAIALASSSSSDMLSKVNDIVVQGYIKQRTSMGGGSEKDALTSPHQHSHST